MPPRSHALSTPCICLGFSSGYAAPEFRALLLAQVFTCVGSATSTAKANSGGRRNGCARALSVVVSASVRVSVSFRVSTSVRANIR
eukprot:2218455-Alexandrium_andersonii.AAC.1